MEVEAANDQLGSIDGAALTTAPDANYVILGNVPCGLLSLSRANFHAIAVDLSNNEEVIEDGSRCCEHVRSHDMIRNQNQF